MNWTTEMGYIKRIHFVGIGGAGMAGIAEVLLELGFCVSGSDLVENLLIENLREQGAKIHLGHDASYVSGVDVVVRSSAVLDDNPEITAAAQIRVPVVARAEMLGELMRFRYGIAIAGTHGKTTTTSLVTAILAEAGCDPTFVIGGKLNQTNSHARLGAGRFLVAEADESDASFLHLKPMLSVITNIDADHLATYKNDFNCLQSAFIEFMKRLPFYGKAILCIDDPVIKDMLSDLPRSFCSYGLTPEANFRAINISHRGVRTYFTVVRPNVVSVLNVTLNLPGRHNVLNALAAIAVATELKVPDKSILKALENFSGIGRRFQIHGDFKLRSGCMVKLVDDYGHHPREVAATLQAAKESWPEKRIVMVYQPHRYTRTRDLFEDFCQVLSIPDKLFLLDIYSAGENPIEGASSSDLLGSMHDNNTDCSAELLESDGLLAETLQTALQEGDVILMQGAGNIGALAQKLAESNFGSKEEEHFHEGVVC